MRIFDYLKRPISDEQKDALRTLYRNVQFIAVLAIFAKLYETDRLILLLLIGSPYFIGLPIFRLFKAERDQIRSFGSNAS